MVDAVVAITVLGVVWRLVVVLAQIPEGRRAQARHAHRSGGRSP